MSKEKQWIKDLVEKRKFIDGTGIQRVYDETKYQPGWLANRDYENDREQAEDDINYIIDEYAKNFDSLNWEELDLYFKKREHIDNLLCRAYADEYVLVDRFCKPQKKFIYDGRGEDFITQLAEQMDCYVVLRKGYKYFAEVGDSIVDLGEWPDINKL